MLDATFDDAEVLFAIPPATLLFQESSCMIGINPLMHPDVTFVFDGVHLVASDGYIIEWPDEESGQRVTHMLRHMRERVLLVEFGPDGPIAAHPIHFN